VTHLLSLSSLHAAAPGVLDVIFGPDGDFEGAPMWGGPVFGLNRNCWWTVAGWTSTDDKIGGALLTDAGGTWPPDHESMPLSWVALDLRVPSVAARLAGLCIAAARPDHIDAMIWYTARALHDACSRDDWATSDGPASLAALTLTLAPRIAALGGPRA